MATLLPPGFSHDRDEHEDDGEAAEDHDGPTRGEERRSEGLDERQRCRPQREVQDHHGEATVPAVGRDGADEVCEGRVPLQAHADQREETAGDHDPVVAADLLQAMGGPRPYVQRAAHNGLVTLARLVHSVAGTPCKGSRGTTCPRRKPLRVCAGWRAP